MVKEEFELECFTVESLRVVYQEFMKGKMSLAEFKARCKPYKKPAYEIIKYFEFEDRIRKGARSMSSHF